MRTVCWAYRTPEAAAIRCDVALSGVLRPRHWTLPRDLGGVKAAIHSRPERSLDRVRAAWSCAAGVPSSSHVDLDRLVAGRAAAQASPVPSLAVV